MLILLIGPKGSGKSHIGRVLERHLGVHFLHVESLWLAYHRECAEAGRQPNIGEGISRIHPLIEQSLRRHTHVCVETTGASGEILSNLLSRPESNSVLTVRVRSSLALCLTRIAARESSEQIPADEARIRLAHRLSERCAVEHDVDLDNNADLSDDEIVCAIGPHFSARRACLTVSEGR